VGRKTHVGDEYDPVVLPKERVEYCVIVNQAGRPAAPNPKSDLKPVAAFVRVCHFDGLDGLYERRRGRKRERGRADKDLEMDAKERRGRITTEKLS
jgi:hypothetical protein